MKKKISDITFKEIAAWANRRCCDGQWSMLQAMVYSDDISHVYNVHKLFRTNKEREKEWERSKKDHYNLNAEIDIDE